MPAVSEFTLTQHGNVLNFQSLNGFKR
uniref:Uncharacterized protein n=1 Tax=Tetranychus urticae TaxID=32264 RepID=T1KCN7_TETUR